MRVVTKLINAKTRQPVFNRPRVAGYISSLKIMAKRITDKNQAGKKRNLPAQSVAKNTPAKRKRGRPQLFSQEIANDIFRQIAEGKFLRRILSSPNMPCIQTFYNNVRSDPKLLEQYTSARACASICYVEEAAEILDNSDPERANLDNFRAKQRNWMAGHFGPDMFGDKKTIELSGNVGTESVAEIKQKEALALLDKVREKRSKTKDP